MNTVRPSSTLEAFLAARSGTSETAAFRVFTRQAFEQVLSSIPPKATERRVARTTCASTCRRFRETPTSPIGFQRSSINWPKPGGLGPRECSTATGGSGRLQRDQPADDS